MNDFRVFAHGPDFAIDEYLASTSFRFDGVWRKGECGRNHPKSSGVYKYLGDGWTTPLSEQEVIATEFLTANRVHLQELALHPQVRTCILGLQYVAPEDAVGLCVGPSLSLMRLCLDVGFLPAYYINLERLRASYELGAEHA